MKHSFGSCRDPRDPDLCGACERWLKENREKLSPRYFRLTVWSDKPNLRARIEDLLTDEGIAVEVKES